MTFIESNPARRLWLASIYTKLGEQGKAEQQWRLGYQESAPFAISVLVLNMVAWLFLPLLSIICMIILKRYKLLPTKEAAPPAEIEPESVETLPLKDRAPTLSEASECFLIWLVAQFVVGGPLVLIAQHFWPHVGQALVATAASGIAALMAVGWLRLRTNEKVIAGWKFAPFGAFLMLAAAIFILSPIGQGIAFIIQHLTGAKPHEPSLLLVSTAQSIPMRIILILMVCCVVPAAEETIFRGLLYRGLRKQWGPVAGMVISSILFSLGHQDILSALPLFVLAMGLAWSVERTGSIVPAVIAHALFNLFPILLLNIMTL
jgi:membrane protease YdiL (CAAX protease family)